MYVGQYEVSMTSLYFIWT